MRHDKTQAHPCLGRAVSMSAGVATPELSEEKLAAARKWLEQSGGIPPEYANLRAQADELARKDVERRAAARQAAIERGEIDP